MIEKGEFKMCEKALDHFITLKEYISEKEYKEIIHLEKLCNLKDKTNLKLELDYKLNICKNSDKGLKNINELLYYVDNVLVAYLGISSFGGNIGEINGMTHPDWRRKGLFKKLFELAVDACKNERFNKLLLLSDGKSNSGIEFIKALGGEYDFSEYRMELLNTTFSEDVSSINLRKADKSDAKEIARQDAIFFNDTEEIESFPKEDELPNQVSYMIELNEKIIGKIKIEYIDNLAFIFGFGILPDFRGKGYGKAALKRVINLINKKGIYNIELDVECKNNTALTLYKACGFEGKSVMNYYKYSIAF